LEARNLLAASATGDFLESRVISGSIHGILEKGISHPAGARQTKTGVRKPARIEKAGSVHISVIDTKLLPALNNRQ
jgi:hypothetical protein